MFDLKNITPYELNKINNNKVKNNIKPSDEEYKNITKIINTQLNKSQYLYLYTMFICKLPKDNITISEKRIMFDLEKIPYTYVYDLENILCDMLYNKTTKLPNQPQQKEILFKKDCDYTSKNSDLYVNNNINIKTDVKTNEHYLEFYNIPRKIQSLNN